MSSSGCQGLQSCLEPLLIEQHVLWLKLAPPHSNFSRSSGLVRRPCLSNSDPEEKPHNEENTTTTTTTTTNTTNNNKNKTSVDDCDSNSHNNGDLGGWSFIQSLTNTSQSSKEVIENDKIYIHPLVKRTSSMLSEKSLEMCTESLGSETGSDISESSDEIPSLSPESTTFLASDRSKMREIYLTKRLNPTRSFPPPLTSISGSGGVQVRPHREGGRLVIKAVTVSPCNTYFHAERGDGRLRLHLLKDNSRNFDNIAAEEKEETSMEDVEEDDEGEAADEDEDEAEEEEVDYDYDYDYEDDDGDSVYWDEDMDGNGENAGGEIGMDRLPRPSRCKEGGHSHKGMWNLEAYNWVATS